MVYHARAAYLSYSTPIGTLRHAETKGFDQGGSRFPFRIPKLEADITWHWTLGDDDIALIKQRRGEENRLGFGMQLVRIAIPAAYLGRRR